MSSKKWKPQVFIQRPQTSKIPYMTSCPTVRFSFVGISGNVGANWATSTFLPNSYKQYNLFNKWNKIDHAQWSWVVPTFSLVRPVRNPEPKKEFKNSFPGRDFMKLILKNMNFPIRPVPEKIFPYRKKNRHVNLMEESYFSAQKCFIIWEINITIFLTSTLLP